MLNELYGNVSIYPRGKQYNIVYGMGESIVNGGASIYGIDKSIANVETSIYRVDEPIVNERTIIYRVDKSNANVNNELYRIVKSIANGEARIYGVDESIVNAKECFEILRNDLELNASETTSQTNYNEGNQQSAHHYANRSCRSEHCCRSDMFHEHVQIINGAYATSYNGVVIDGLNTTKGANWLLHGGCICSGSNQQTQFSVLVLREQIMPPYCSRRQGVIWGGGWSVVFNCSMMNANVKRIGGVCLHRLRALCRLRYLCGDGWCANPCEAAHQCDFPPAGVAGFGDSDWSQRRERRGGAPPKPAMHVHLPGPDGDSSEIQRKLFEEEEPRCVDPRPPARVTPQKGYTEQSEQVESSKYQQMMVFQMT